MTILNLSNLLIFSLISFGVLSICYRYLKKNKRYDLNMLQLSKNKNTVTSLGISFYIIFFLSLIYLFLYSDLINYLPNRYYIFFVALTILTIISYIDDKNEIDAKIKLIIQLIVVYFSLTNLELQNINLPLKLTIFLALVTWVYIINVVNFIDGSDGHCSLFLIFFMLGIFLIGYVNKTITYSIIINFTLIPSLIFFLLFYNLPKAKAYMGDTGSIFFGFIVGFVSLEYLLMGKIICVLTLLIYPLLDCTLTLIIKMFKGYYPWVKLGDYFFLIPIRKNNLHKNVLLASLIFNMINLTTLYLILKYNNYFFLLSLFSALVLLYYFKSFKNAE